MRILFRTAIGAMLLGMQMFYQRLAGLFARYCAVHLNVIIPGLPLTGPTDKTLGHIDRVSLRGHRYVVEGWADAEELVFYHAGQRLDLTPNLHRSDVSAAFQTLKTATPGFSIALSKGHGAATLTLVRDGVHYVFAVAMPDERRVTRAKAALILPFIRDLGRATPILLHWLATKDPADRGRLKQKLRLTLPAKAKAMQSLLFVQDCLADLPEPRKTFEMLHLNPPALAHRAITIVLPIYNALDLLPEVLDRIVQHTDLPWRLVLIEDASTDPGVRPFLQLWIKTQTPAVRNQVTLIENHTNQGFILSVNAGLQLAIGHGDDAVLLNSDAFVPKAWASRLMRPFLVHDRVASVTPMSNDAEIFSVPMICNRSALAPGQADAMDAIAAKLHPDAAVADAPTGVGFCMAMSKDYLRRIPALDPAFGRGYGEEVDWCQKASTLGGRHLGLGNLFVEHRGGSSFGSAEKQRLVARSSAEITRRYPDYDAKVQGFVADDPLATPRLALAVVWAAAQAKNPIPVYLAHNLGGGADDYLTQRIARDLPAVALVLRVGTAHRWQLELHCTHGILHGATDDFTLIQRMLAPIERLRIVYSCGVGDSDPANLPSRLLSLRRGDQDRLEVLIHDYLPISPSYTLLGSDGRYQGPPDPSTDDPAHRHRMPDGCLLPLADWQAAWRNLLNQANEIIVFSSDSADVLTRVYPAARQKLQVKLHAMLYAPVALTHRPAASRPVIGVLGNIGYHKGAGVLQDLSKAFDLTDAAKLVVLGQIDPMYPLAASAQVHGGYLRRDIATLATLYGITDWLIPSIWPETFSYATHEAIGTGLPVWCFDLGAQGDAVRTAAMGRVIAIPAGVPDLDALLDAILMPRQHPAVARTESRAA